jgi:hypothetical protein
MLRVHRDFKGLLKDVQDEYDFLAELNKSLQKVVLQPKTLSRYAVVRCAERDL